VNGNAQRTSQVEQHPGPAKRHGLPFCRAITLRGIAGPLDIYHPFACEQTLFNTGGSFGGPGYRPYF
jgi:hypothetical protein